MKKTIALLLALCLCIGLCACGGNTEPTEAAKSTEAQKADELILAIGEVSLDKESAIIAAKAYYDTLSDEQKAQVENYSILESAQNELELLKKESEYKEIYKKALEYEDLGLIDKAYAEYEKLPENYENSANRMALLKPYVGLIGYWVSDTDTATASNGTPMTVGMGGYIFECGGITENAVYINYSGLIGDSNSSNNSIFKNAFDLMLLMQDGGISGECRMQEDGSFYLGKNEGGKTNFGTMTISFFINPDGKLRVEYSKTTDGQNTSIVFTYSKK